MLIGEHVAALYPGCKASSAEVHPNFIRHFKWNIPSAIIDSKVKTVTQMLRMEEKREKRGEEKKGQK